MRVTGEENLNEAAEWLLSRIGEERIIAFNGQMGAGKTTFIKSLCQFMEVEDEVSSPTFSLVNEYFSEKYGSIYHFDLYRLKDESEAWDIGIEDYLYSGAYCFIEWPEKIRNLIPPQHVHLDIDVDGLTRVFKLNQPSA